MVFIAAGLGGGTGTGAAPVVAQAAKEMGILTVAVVTKPFDFEGAQKAELAEEGLRKLKDVVDTYIVIHNQKLATIAGKRFTLGEAFKLVDSILYKAVRGITDLILVPGLINVSPLLEGVSIQGSKRLLINIEVSMDLSYADVEEAIAQIREATHPESLIIFGASLNPNVEDEIRVTVVATDFEDEKQEETKKKKIEKRIPKRTLPPAEKEDTKEEPKIPGGLINEIEYEDLDIPAYIRKRKGEIN